MARRLRLVLVLLISAVLVNGVSPAIAAQLDATWICQDSAFHEWTDPACWDLGGAIYPDNTAGNTFRVFIDSNLAWNSKVNLPGTPSIDIDSLEVGAGDVVRIDAGNFSVFEDGPGTGTVLNHGVIQLNSAGNWVHFYFGPHLELSGIGEVFLNGDSHNRLVSIHPSVLTNISGHTIRGGGLIGNNSTIVNQGMIQADLDGFELVLNPREDESSVNESLLRSYSGADLVINRGSWDNSTGSIGAFNGGFVTIKVAADVAGGLIASGTGGVVRLDGGHLADVTVSGLLRVLGGSLEGTITNQGTIDLDENPLGYVILIIDSDVELEGGGDLIVFPSVFNYVEGRTGAERLTNTMGHTIQGGSTIGRDKLAFTNLGLIVANQSALALTVDGADSLSNINENTLRATNGAELVLKDTTWQNNGGVIEALHASKVDILQSTIEGGILRSVSTGVVRFHWSSHLDGVTNNGFLFADHNGANDTTYLHGIITNNGTLAISSGMQVVCDGSYLATLHSTTWIEPWGHFQLSSTTVMEGTLTGEGSFEGTLELADSGLLDPGLPTGTLHTFDLTIESGAHYLWQIDADAADLVNVQGTLDFGAARLYVTPQIIGVDTPENIVLFEYDQLPVVPDTSHIILSGGFEYHSISTADNRITLVGVDFDPEIFADGFEGGDTSAWSAVQQ